MDRRAFIALVGAALALPGRALAACLPTPRQTMGPFYPASGIAGAVTDLTRTRPDGPLARVPADGRRAFKTIVPAPYDGRTAHIHFRFRVRVRGRHDLVLLNQLSEDAHARVVVALEPPAEGQEPTARRCAFEIALG